MFLRSLSYGAKTRIDASFYAKRPYTASEYAYNGQSAQFCRENFLSENSLEMIEGMKGQLVSELASLGFIKVSPILYSLDTALSSISKYQSEGLKTSRLDIPQMGEQAVDWAFANRNAGDLSLLRSVVGAGMYPNFVVPSGERSTR